MMAGNIKAIGVIARLVAAASLAKITHFHPPFHPPCFLRGTKVRTVVGERNVEDLAVGDLLPTVFGEARPIQWIIRYRQIRCDSGKPWMSDALPVCIKSSAIAADVPHTDLYVTQGHALLIDGLLVPAGGLVNGTTIALYAAEEYDELEFFHVKLESHDVIYAEGAPCETLLNVDKSESTFVEYCRKYGTPEAVDRHCAPIVYNGAKSRVRGAMSLWLGPQKIDIIRGRLEERAINLRSVGQSGAASLIRHHPVEGAVR